jgi:SAM-dependent methyltransferase
VTSLDADYFDQWYADQTGSAVLESAKQRHLGLPPELLSTSLLTLDGLREIGGLLGIGSSERLLDLACGRGGYGLWLARETGASVIGVDFSGVAVRQAQAAIEAFDLGKGRAAFEVGELEATGLPDAAVDATLCVDAVQFAGDVVTALREMLRVTRPGGVVVLTAWQTVDATSASVPERLRRLDLGPQLEAAGFVDVMVVDRSDWRESERAFWEEAVACDPDRDPALESWHEEGVRVLSDWDSVRRIVATARTPARDAENAG